MQVLSHREALPFQAASRVSVLGAGSRLFLLLSRQTLHDTNSVIATAGRRRAQACSCFRWGRALVLRTTPGLPCFYCSLAPYVSDGSRLPFAFGVCWRVRLPDSWRVLCFPQSWFNNFVFALLRVAFLKCFVRHSVRAQVRLPELLDRAAGRFACEFERFRISPAGRNAVPGRDEEHLPARLAHDAHMHLHERKL